MNKSKFLKKSLAMLLALMLVVAMIPLSAAAAEAPVITQITVNDVVATGSGDNYTAEIADPGTADVKVAVTLKDGNGSIDKGTSTQGRWEYTLNDDEKTAKSVSFNVFDAENTKTQTVTVTYTVTAKNTDTSVKSVAVDGMYAVSNVGNDYTVVVPYGSQANSAKVVLNSDKAKVSNATLSDGAYTVTGLTIGTASSFTVEAESGNKEAYTVKLVSAKAFTEFSVAGERKAALINRVTEGYDTEKTVDVQMPYGTVADANASYKFTPTFTKAYEGAKITATYNKVVTEIVSGTEYDLAKFDGVTLTKDTSINDKEVTLTVTYSEGKTEDWTLSFDVPTTDPVAAIKGLTVGNYAATIEGKEITLTLPKSLRVANGKITLDTTSKVDIVGTALTNTTAGTADITGVDLTKDSYTLRVTAAGKEDTATSNEVVDYKLTIKTAAVESAKLNTMTLEDTKGNQYKGVIDQNKGTITFEVPYAVKEKAGVKDWKLFYAVSSGSTVTELKISGSKLAGTENFIPAGNAATGFTGADAVAATPIEVTTPDLDSKTYTIVFKNAPAKTGSTLGTVELTSVDEFAKMNETNTIKASVSGKKITVKVPHNQWTAFNTAVVATTLPEGAKLYYAKTNGELTEVVALNKDTEGTVTNKLPAIDGASAGGYPEYNNSKTPLTLVVASEAVGTITNMSALTNNYLGKYSTYELAVLKEDPRTTAELTGFSVYDAISKKTATGTISGTDITITLPYYFTDAARGSKLYLDYSVRGGEALKANDTATTALKDLVLNKDGTVNDTNSFEVVYDAASKKLKGAKTPDGFDTITVTSENTKVEVEYTLTVKIAEANTEAKLNSVTIKGVTATPDANNKVSIVLPFGTEVTSLAPTFNVSTNAYVKFGGNVVEQGATYNFLTDKTFTVYSENGVNTATYTVNVTTSAQFTDVKPGDWYYKNVMRAVELGILSGKGNGIFAPHENITRRDFAIMLAQSLGHDNSEPATSPFVDVADDDYGVSSIAYLYEQGITAGDNEGKFNPTSKITRQEAATMLAKAFKATGTSTELYADDAKIANWAKSFVYACKDAGLMKGDVAGTFRPNDTFTRAEAASAMVNAVDK